jgi:hypothetical protein
LSEAESVGLEGLLNIFFHQPIRLEVSALHSKVPFASTEQEKNLVTTKSPFGKYFSFAFGHTRTDPTWGKLFSNKEHQT